MHIYRVYACDPRLIDRRLQLLIESTGCATACGHYRQLSEEEVAESVALDERMDQDPTAAPYFRWMAREHYTVYLVEVWCRYVEGFCPLRSYCHLASPHSPLIPVRPWVKDRSPQIQPLSHSSSCR